MKAAKKIDKKAIPPKLFERQTLWLTREADPNCPFQSGVSKLGANLLTQPLIQTQPLLFNLPDTEADKISWLFFSSQEGVKHFYSQLTHPLPDSLQSARIASIGPATAKAIEALGHTVNWVAPIHNGESAALALTQFTKAGDKVLWPCGTLANPQIASILKQGQVNLFPVTVYQTELLPPTCWPKGFDNLQKTAPDWLIFTSPSNVKAYAQSVLKKETKQPAYVAIGPSTAKAIEEHLGHVALCAEPSTMKGLLDTFIRNSYPIQH